MITLSATPPTGEIDVLIEMPSPSWFAVRALEGFTSAADLLASGRLKAEDFKQLDQKANPVQCWRCGGDIHHPVNDGYCMPYKPKAKFNDHWECKAKHNKIKVLCAACEAVSHATYHPNFKLNALYTQDAAYQLTLDEDLMSFLINPPPPPYLFCMAENNSQHMCWLARYTLDNRLMAITKSRTWGLVDREKALALAESMKGLLDLTNQIRTEKGGIALSTPLLSSRKEINTIHSSNMQLSRSVYAAIKPEASDTVHVRALREQLAINIQQFERQSFCYLTWYVATMFLKALLTEFTPKPIEEWQRIEAPQA